MAVTGGIIVTGVVGLPSHGPHVLSARLPDSEGEFSLMKLPADGSGRKYHELALALNRASISVHFFSVGPDYLDIATLGIPSGLTCGSCSHYPKFGDVERETMHSNLFGLITAAYCWDASLSMVWPKGIKVIRVHCNCTIRNNAVFFPVTSRDSTILFELAIDGQLDPAGALLQAVFTFSTDEGCRIVRVLTFKIPTSADCNLVCRSIDESCLFSLLVRQTVAEIIIKGPIQGIAAMKKRCQMIVGRKIPLQSMSHLLHAMLCHTMTRGSHPSGIDGRMAEVIRCRAMGPVRLILFFYPRLIVVDTEQTLLPLSGRSFAAGGCFVVHTIDRIFIWVAKVVSAEFLRNAFGVASVDELGNTLPTIGSEENRKLQQILGDCWNLTGKYVPVEVIPQESPREEVFREILVDDSDVCDWMPFAHESTDRIPTSR
jgi:hypothetical protein